jgi:hypothetical protein
MMHAVAATVVAAATLTQPSSDVLEGLVPPGFAGLMQIGEVFEPDFLRRDLTIIDEDLDLDEVRGPIVESLLLDYEAAFAAAVEATLERLGEEHPELLEEAANAGKRRKRLAELRDEMLRVRGEMARSRSGRSLANGRGLDASTTPASKRLNEISAEIRELAVDVPTGERLQLLIDAYEILSGPWRRQRETLRAEFVAGLLSSLSESQQRQWPATERTLRRQRSLGRGRYSGESVDLLVMAREMNLPVEGEPGARLDRYTIELDEAIVARDRQLDDNRFDLVQAVAAGDAERAATLQTREIDCRVAIRSVNERCVEDIALIYEEADRTRLAAAVRKDYLHRAFRRIFRRDDIDEEFAAVRQRTDLPEETLLVIHRMEAEYVVELDRFNGRLVDLTRKQEPLEQAERLQRRVARLTGEKTERADDDPIRDVRRERRKMRRRYEDRLEAVLENEVDK